MMKLNHEARVVGTQIVRFTIGVEYLYAELLDAVLYLKQWEHVALSVLNDA